MQVKIKKTGRSWKRIDTIVNRIVSEHGGDIDEIHDVVAHETVTNYGLDIKLENEEKMKEYKQEYHHWKQELEKFETLANFNDLEYDPETFEPNRARMIREWIESNPKPVIPRLKPERTTRNKKSIVTHRVYYIDMNYRVNDIDKQCKLFLDIAMELIKKDILSIIEQSTNFIGDCIQAGCNDNYTSIKVIKMNAIEIIDKNVFVTKSQVQKKLDRMRSDLEVVINRIIYNLQESTRNFFLHDYLILEYTKKHGIKIDEKE
jgi:hypothetical protein